jgi:hypothetical protein
MVSRKLKSSLSISETGKNIIGIFTDFINPADAIILAIDWLVKLAKKNQMIRPEVQYKT